MASTTQSSIAPGLKTLTILPQHAFPYTQDSTESKFFRLPLEVRQQIYEYVLHTPNAPFLKTIKGWRDCPHYHELQHVHELKGMQLFSVSKQMRAEALPVFFMHSQFRLEGFPLLRSLLNLATNMDYGHLYIRKISIVPWYHVRYQTVMNRWVYEGQGQCLLEALADLPSLRELELYEKYLPQDVADYSRDEWRRLMETLSGNNGTLKILAAGMADTWNFPHHIFARENYEYGENVMLKTTLAIKTWNELVEIQPQRLSWWSILDDAAQQTYGEGPFKNVKVQSEGRDYIVRIWGVPWSVRRSMVRKKERKQIKMHNAELRKSEVSSRQKATRLASLALDFDEDWGCTTSVVQSGRAKQNVTREDARMRRLEKNMGRRLIQVEA